jgi:hypothetical protein
MVAPLAPDPGTPGQLRGGTSRPGPASVTASRWFTSLQPVRRTAAGVPRCAQRSTTVPPYDDAWQPFGRIGTMVLSSLG